MDPLASALSTQQLAEFLAVVSTVADAGDAVQMAAERACRALDAEVGAVVADGAVLAAVGFPVHRMPTVELVEAVAGRRTTLRMPGLGECLVQTAPIGGTTAGHLLIARSGSGRFTVDEVSLVRGMARVVELTVDRLRTLEAERHQAAENARLLVTVQERQRLLEQLSGVQRAIARRAPLQQILDSVTMGARELLSGGAVTLWLRDTEDPESLLTVSHSDAVERTTGTDTAGVANRALLGNGLAVDGPTDAYRAVAAPVHVDGAAVGSLAVSGGSYDKRDAEVLQAFAEHVSLAVTDARTLEAMHQAFHDWLTGLASRKLFMDRLDHTLFTAAREGQRTAVLFVDLDRFKHVNDSLGHAVGDALLVEVAARLLGCLRADDTAARLGGDEFAVILSDVTEPETAAGVAHRIIERLRSPFRLGGSEVFVGASVGIAVTEPGSAAADELIGNADLAMYQAKKGGKDRYVVFEPAMQTSQARAVELEADLRRAVHCSEFVVHYQPIVDLRTDRISGFEALVRWQRPDHGLVPPLEFIPLAEEIGLITPIGTAVLREACRQTAAWNARRAHMGDPALSVSVNLSARQVLEADFAAVVAEAVDDAGLDPSCLVLEITESMLVTDTEATMGRLNRLKALGVRLAIDDFGTGYSSLSYLRHFPVDIVKIDKSFVDELADEQIKGTLAQAIVTLGHTLELVTVAEGIEAPAQSDALRRAGCELGQGYHFARPLDTAAAEGLLFQPGQEGRQVAA